MCVYVLCVRHNPLLGLGVDATRRLRVQGGGHGGWCTAVHLLREPAQAGGWRCSKLKVCTTVGLAAAAAVEVEIGARRAQRLRYAPEAAARCDGRKLRGTCWRRASMGDRLLVVLCYVCLASLSEGYGLCRGRRYVEARPMGHYDSQWACRPWGTQPNGVSVF